jgi:hypothetical protein
MWASCNLGCINLCKALEMGKLSVVFVHAETDHAQLQAGKFNREASCPVRAVPCLVALLEGVGERQ